MYVVSYVPVHSMPETTKLVERSPSLGAQATLFSLSLSPTQNHSFVFLIFSISEDIFHSLFASFILCGRGPCHIPVTFPHSHNHSMSKILSNLSSSISRRPFSDPQAKCKKGHHFTLLTGLPHHSSLFLDFCCKSGMS